MTDQSLRNLAATGATWIALVARCGQEKVNSTAISCTTPATATDAELSRIVRLAHSLNLRVMLKPQIDVYNDPGNDFRGLIGSAFTTDAQWGEWFISYRQFISRFATFSQQNGVDLFTIGVELGGTTHRDKEWRAIVSEVRQLYKGPITYASLSSTGAPAPHGEENRITWWDAVDYIGIDAYYPLTTKNNPTVAEMKAAWISRGHLALLENLTNRTQKKIIFTEFGYRSLDGANRVPGAYQNTGTIDLQEQADAYQAGLETLMGRPWLAGIFWWQWFASPNIGGPTDDGFTPFGKPAEQTLKSFYSQP